MTFLYISEDKVLVDMPTTPIRFGLYDEDTVLVDTPTTPIRFGVI